MKLQVRKIYTKVQNEKTVQGVWLSWYTGGDAWQRDDRKRGMGMLRVRDCPLHDGAAFRNGVRGVILVGARDSTLPVMDGASEHLQHSV